MPPRSFDLAVSADAFHWIRPEVGYPKVQAALKENGSFAFFWQISIDPQTDWSRAVDEIFQRLAPQYDRPNKPMEIEQYRNIITGNFREYCGIADVTIKLYGWIEILSAERYVKLLHTYSGFRGMDDNLREALNKEIFAAIQNAGESAQQPYRAAKPVEGDVVGVVVPRPLKGALDYRVPDGVRLARGDIVEVPLGRGGDATLGIVWGKGEGGFDRARLKQIARRFDVPPLKEELLQFATWVANYAWRPWAT